MNDSRPGLAALWMIGAVVSFSAMAVAGRYTASELDTFELMMYRSFIGVLLVVGVATVAGTLGQVSTHRFGLHVVRNILHFSGQNLWFFALSLIPLAQLIALEFTTPLWVLVLAPLVLGEALTRTRVLAAVVGFAGILIVARPGAVPIGPGLIAGATCAIGFAGAMLCTKILTRTASVTCILFWLVTLQSVFGIVTAGYDGDIAVPSLDVLPWVVVVACGGLMAHLSITKALTLAPASIVGPVDFVRLPLIAVIGMMLFAEPLDPLVFAGGALIIAANFLNLRAEARLRTQRQV